MLVKTLDRSSGFVVAEVAVVPAKELADYTSNCGTFESAMQESIKARAEAKS